MSATSQVQFIWLKSKKTSNMVCIGGIRSAFTWVNFVPAEMKARYDKLPWFKVHFCFAGVPSLCDESLWITHVLELQQQNKIFLSLVCRNILHLKLLRKHFLLFHNLKPYCNNSQQLFCCFNLCSTVSFHTLLLLSRWGFLWIQFKKSVKSLPSICNIL